MISELVVLVELSSALFRQRPLALQARCGGTHFELGVLTNGTTPPVLNRQRKDSIEPAPSSNGREKQNIQRGQWAEFEKVGEVVEEMGRLGREQFVVEMGIGSAGNTTPSK